MWDWSWDEAEIATALYLYLTLLVFDIVRGHEPGCIKQLKLGNRGVKLHLPHGLIQLLFRG